ncbi:MAG: 2-oxoglutarate ferredoxin oxidoreductase subunit beta [Spirochaetales bacterium]|nr:2-oxoglutarate ferredoxin oxidoreductase subunit beta [Spirochaetales bacterium]
MSYGTKPKVSHPSLPPNKIGLLERDYEGVMSTLCAGCGHDSVTAAIIRAVYELAIPPHRVAKFSGIGCSSKTPTYFLGAAHGVNSLHGRMPSIASGANAANRDLYIIGTSGDGDSLSIGFGQFAHVARRNVNMLYVLQNNGVYGLTKGQFSASADLGSKLKKGETNQFNPIDPALLAISLGASFVARSFSGDKEQLIPLIKVGLRHGGFAFIDVISPCVTFNDHEASTKSYMHTRENRHEVVHMDFIQKAEEIVTQYEKGASQRVVLHDGTPIVLKKTTDDFDPTDPISSHAYIRENQLKGQIATGLLYIDESVKDMHEVAETVETPLVDVPFEKLNPGAGALEELQAAYR